jgi:hypothetical protein
VIGACGKKPDWCMVYGTGKMACPECYPYAANEAFLKGQEYVKDFNKEVAYA